jgi:hypothetical protein
MHAYRRLTVFLKNCRLGPFGFGLPGVDAPSYTGVKTFGDPEWDSPKVQLQALFNLFGGMSVHHSGVSDARDLWMKFRMVTPESVLWIGWEYTKAGKTIRTPDQTIALADVELRGSQDGSASMLLKAPADVPHLATEQWVRLSLDVNGDESVYVPPPDRWMLVPIRSDGKDSTWSEKLNSWEH